MYEIRTLNQLMRALLYCGFCLAAFFWWRDGLNPYRLDSAACIWLMVGAAAMAYCYGRDRCAFATQTWSSFSFSDKFISSLLGVALLISLIKPYQGQHLTTVTLALIIVCSLLGTVVGNYELSRQAGVDGTDALFLVVYMLINGPRERLMSNEAFQDNMFAAERFVRWHVVYSKLSPADQQDMLLIAAFIRSPYPYVSVMPVFQAASRLKGLRLAPRYMLVPPGQHVDPLDELMGVA